MRTSEEVCPDCGQPIIEVRVGDDWISRGRCLLCEKARSDRKFKHDVQDRNMRRSHLYTKSLDSFETPMGHQKRGLAAAQELIARVIRGQTHVALVLWSSGYGTGKTHLVSGIARALRRRGYTIASWLEPELFAAIRDSYGGHDASERRIIQKVIESDVLIIDDLGRAYVTEEKLGWYREKIYRIVNARYQRSAPLVLTTNCSASGDELQTRIGGAAYSRLWEMARGGDLVVNLNGPDWRARQFERGNPKD
jgi:DNA replication protein DnaC